MVSYRKIRPMTSESGDNVRELILALSDLAKGRDGITPAFGECLSQAASVCLEDQSHKSGVNLNVDGDFNRIFGLI